MTLLPPSRSQTRFVLPIFFVVLFSGGPALADVADNKWQDDTTSWHWGRDRVVDIIQTDVNVTLDPRVVRVDGTVTLTFAPIMADVRHLTLDAERLVIDRITDERDRPLEYSMEDHGFTVNFPEPLSEPETTSIRIEYHGEPTMGLYYIPAEPKDPDRVPMIWSQGQAEENRFWFPGYDYPNERATSSVSVRTPRPNVVVSNGRMERVEEHNDGTRTFRWTCDVPISNYLIAIAVGQFDSLVQSTTSGLRVPHYCRKGLGAWLEPSMSETPGMIEFYERAIGVKFPFAQYAQVMVSDFIHGGMENAGMTINTETTLHSERGHEFYRDGTNALLAHELAHQWFGDLVGYNDWAHAWLGEGFASYFEDLWIEDRWGRGRFQLSMNNSRQSGLGAARGTRRSTVHHQYKHPDDHYNSYSYSRAATVLHMIRGLLGDSLWWASINSYVTDYYAKTAETEDFKDAIENTSGRDFDWFFDQWLYHGGHPELSIRTSYDADAQLLKVDVEQTQTVDDVTPLFRFPLTIEWVAGDDRRQRIVQVSEKQNTFYVPAENKPDYILIDPEGWLLADFDYEPSSSALLAQIGDTSRVLARLRAIEALGKEEPSGEILNALTQALRHDTQYAIRSAAARALGELGGDAARDSLLAGLDDPHPQVRNRVVYALGEFEGDDIAFARLAAIANSNNLDPVRGSAIDAASMVDPQRAAPLARSAIARRSEKYTIESDAFGALARTKDESLIPTALRYVAPGNPTAVRVNALGLIRSLARYEKDEKVREKYSLGIESYLDNRNMNFRRPLMRTIGALGRDGAVDALQRVERQSPQDSEQEVAQEAIKAIREHKPEDAPNTIAREIEEETDEREKLEKRIDDLEKRLDAALEGKGKSAEASPPE